VLEGMEANKIVTIRETGDASTLKNAR
jgi:hypothetical protein